MNTIVMAVRMRARSLARSINDAYNLTIPDAEAFLSAHNGPVTFNKTGTSCESANGATCWGKTFGNRIDIYTNAYSENEIGELVPRFIDNHKFPLHELGHTFESSVNSVLGPNYIRNTLTNDPIIRNTDPGDLNGFAGRYPGWRQSPENTAGELFADMTIGFDYNQWATYPTGTLTAMGAARSNFMQTYMPIWAALRIAH